MPQPRSWDELDQIDRGNAERRRNGERPDGHAGERPAPQTRAGRGENRGSGEAEQDARARLDGLERHAESQRGAGADTELVQSKRRRACTRAEVAGRERQQAPAPARGCPGGRGRSPASAIAASSATATINGRGIPIAATSAIAAASRAPKEHAIQRATSIPVRGERKICSAAATRPATRLLSRDPIASATSTISATIGAGHNGAPPSTAAARTSAASASARAPATTAPTPHVRSTGSPPERVRDSSPIRTAPPRCAGATELTREPTA